MHFNQVLVIGISGITCGGKTTLATELHNLLPNSIVVSQDDYFRHESDSKHTWIKELNHINFDILSSLDMEKMHEDLKELVAHRTMLSKLPDKKDFTSFTNQEHLKASLYEVLQSLDLQVIIVEGFCIFGYEPLLPLFHIKYFFTLEYEECHKRRVKRIYEPPDCPGYFEKCVWPEYLKHLEEIKKLEEVTFFSGKTESPLNCVLGDILRFFQ